MKLVGAPKGALKRIAKAADMDRNTVRETAEEMLDLLLLGTEEVAFGSPNQSLKAPERSS